MKQNERRIELSKQSIYLIMMCVLDLLVGVTLGVKIIVNKNREKKSTLRSQCRVSKRFSLVPL